MDIREVKEGDVVVLVPDATLTGNDAARAIEAKLEATIKAGGKFLVLDCAAVRQLTSVSVRALLTASRRLERVGGRLVLCDMNAQLKKAFSISGVDKDFTVVATREEGVQRALQPVESQRSVKIDAAVSPPVVEPPPAFQESPVAVPLMPAATPPVVVADAVNSSAVVAGGASRSAVSSATASDRPSATAARLDALAEALFEVLDIPSVTIVSSGAGRAARSDAEGLATMVLAALRASGSLSPNISNVPSVGLKGEA